MFAEFRDRSSLPIDPVSVAKRDPPEPDIYCEIERQGGVAFELAALRDQRIAQIQSNLANQDVPNKSRYLRLNSRDTIRHVCRKKRTRTYKTPHPIELVLYAVGPLAPEDFVIPHIESAFHHGDHLGPFRRVWYMGRSNERCVCILPVLA